MIIAPSRRFVFPLVLACLFASIAVFQCSSKETQDNWHSPFIRRVSVNPDGKTFATVDSVVSVWDLAKGKELHAEFVGPAMDLAYSPDGKLLAVCELGGDILIWNLERGWNKRVFPRESPQGGAHGIAFSPDGKHLASCGVDKVVIWDVASGSVLKQIRAKGDIIMLEYSPDGKLIATAGGSDGLVIWNAESGAPVYKPSLGRTPKGKLSSHPVFALAFSPDGRLLATGDPGGTVRIWNMSEFESNPLPKPPEIPTIGYQVLGLAFSPDGKLLAGARSDKPMVWDVATQRELKVFQGHDYCLRDVAWTPDGKTLLSSSDDGTVIIWDAQSGEQKSKVDIAVTDKEEGTDQN